jgi:hypothetical protein
MNTIASQPTRLCSKMIASTQTDMTDDNYTTTTAVVNRMKMAQMLLKQSREQIEKFEKERVSLINLVKMMASELNNFRQVTNIECIIIKCCILATSLQMICIEFVTINSWPPMTLHSITSN